MTETETKSTPKETLIRRIKALLSKTVENGATEAEAMSAVAKAQEIMQAYGLDREAVEAEAFVKEKYASKKATRAYDWSSSLAHGISAFTGTFAWVEDAAIVYAGKESDTMFAYWLTDALDAFVTRAALGYIAEAGGVRTGAKRVASARAQNDLFAGTAVTQRSRESEYDRSQRIRDFCLGVCSRISERLKELTTDASRQRQRDAKARLEREGMHFSRRGGGRRNISDRAAFQAGHAAGNGAAFNQPINRGAGVRMIGAR